MKIIVGAGKTKYNGWVSTQENELNLLNLEQWERLKENEEIEAILAEHVWEHLSLEDGIKETAKWYLEHNLEVNKKPYFEYIDSNLRQI